MKKLLGAVLALAFVVVTSQANAELLKNFKFGGSVELDAVSARNAVSFAKGATGVPTDHVGTAQTRIMLNMDWDLLDDVHSKITLDKNNRVYGAAGSENVNGVQVATLLDQAYFKIDKVFGFVDSTFGRQFYGEAGDLIAYYGPRNSYGMTVTAIDGARFDWTGEKAYATVVMYEPTGHPGLAVSNYAKVNDVRGFIVGNKGNENIDAKVYIWNQETHGIAVAGSELKNTNLYIPGFKVKGKFGGLYGSLEAAFNFGDDRANSGGFAGKAVLADVGMKADVERIGTFNPWAQFGYGSGNGAAANQQHNMNFQSIATDYRPGAIYGRFDQTATAGTRLFNGVATTAGNGLQNRIIWGLGVKATPSALNKLTVGAAYYDFNFQNLGAGTAANAGNRHIGSEVDVTGEWKHSENVSLKGTIGDFQPGGFIVNQVVGTHVSPALLSAFDVCVKF